MLFLAAKQSRQLISTFIATLTCDYRDKMINITFKTAINDTNYKYYFISSQQT